MYWKAMCVPLEANSFICFALQPFAVQTRELKTMADWRGWSWSQETWSAQDWKSWDWEDEAGEQWTEEQKAQQVEAAPAAEAQTPAQTPQPEEKPAQEVEAKSEVPQPAPVPPQAAQEAKPPEEETKKVRFEEVGAASAASASPEKGGKKGGQGKGQEKGWQPQKSKPYNMSQGGLASSQWRDEMRSLHYRTAPAIPLQCFMDTLAYKACQLVGIQRGSAVPLLFA